jgi:hypothetical protein
MKKLLLLLTLVFVTGCATTPITGQESAKVYPEGSWQIAATQDCAIQTISFVGDSFFLETMNLGSDFHESGTWSIDGDSLVIFSTIEHLGRTDGPEYRKTNIFQPSADTLLIGGEIAVKNIALSKIVGRWVVAPENVISSEDTLIFSPLGEFSSRSISNQTQIFYHGSCLITTDSISITFEGGRYYSIAYVFNSSLIMVLSSSAQTIIATKIK